MSQYGYGGSRNPYDQRDDPGYGRDDRGYGRDNREYGRDDRGYGQPARRPPPQQIFGARPGSANQSTYSQSTMGRDEYSARDHEMSQLRENPAPFAQGGGGNNSGRAVLDECRKIGDGISDVERNLDRLQVLYDRSISEGDETGPTKQQIDKLSADIMALYRGLTQRVRQLKSMPESRQAMNVRQVGNIDGRLKAVIQRYLKQEGDFKGRVMKQVERQILVIDPNMPAQQVSRAAQDIAEGGGSVFQQAMMRQGRTAQGQAALNNVQNRRQELEKIEKQMGELAQLFMDLDTLVVQQEVAIQQIEQKGEEVVEHLDKGNDEIAIAVTTAKKTRKKKWICLGICVVIILLIAAGITAYVFITKAQNKGKRSIQISAFEMATAEVPRAVAESSDKDLVAHVYRSIDVGPNENSVTAVTARSTMRWARRSTRISAEANVVEALAEKRYVVPGQPWTKDGADN